MEIEYTLRAQEDIAHWKKSGNVKIQKKYLNYFYQYKTALL